MTNLNPKIKYSDRLFHNQYRHCIRGELPWVHSVKELNNKKISFLLQMWDAFEHYSKKINYGGSWRQRHVPVSENHSEKLKIVCDWFINHLDQIKLQFNKDRVFIYTNNNVLINSLDSLDVFDKLSITTVELDRPKDTVKARYPGFAVRAYLRPTHITVEQRESLIKFIQDNEPYIRTNVGLERFIHLASSRYNYLTLRDYFFIDLSSQSLLSALELMCPGLVRKTVDIIYDDK